MSESGPEATIIDCGGSASDPHRGFNFVNMEGPEAEVRGFTIRNGYAFGGGAIMCWGTSPTIQGNIIRNCTATGSGGGGILCWESNAVIRDNVISDCFAPSAGGAISQNRSDSM